MGSKIIVRNADFSANAVAQTPTYLAEAIGSSESIWSQATSVGSHGSYGALVQNAGYATALKMYAPADGTQATHINVYAKNGAMKGSYDVMPSYIKEGLNVYNFTSPIQVEVDDVICVSGYSGAFQMMYKSSGGDYPVSTSAGNVPESGWRIYRFNFIIQVEQQ